MTEPMRVLVVEPDDQSAYPCMQELEQRGWQVERAREFADALALVQGSAYDIVIMDVMLPDILGTDAWRRFKALRPEMACIMTTNSASIRDGVDAFDLDVLDFMLKPFKMDAVANLIMQEAKRQQGIARIAQQERELSGIAIWLSNIGRATTRRQVLDAAEAHLEVILPGSWTAVYFTPDGRRSWISRSIARPTVPEPWTPRQSAFVEGLAKEALESHQITSKQSLAGTLESGSQEQALGVMVVTPLVTQGRTHGVLVFVDEQHSDQELSPVENELAMVISRILTLALDRVHLVKELHTPAIPAKHKARVQV